MYRLTCFELDKVWRKRSFLLSVAVLLAINIFFYSGIPTCQITRPSLSAYKAVEKDLQHLSEAEKRVLLKIFMKTAKA